MIAEFLAEITAAAVWVVANVVYLDLRRKGRRRPLRFLSFFAGWPLTFLTLAKVKEGVHPSFTPPPDDETLLLREIRADRERRGGGSGEGGSG